MRQLRLVGVDALDERLAKSTAAVAARYSGARVLIERHMGFNEYKTGEFGGKRWVLMSISLVVCCVSTHVSRIGG